MFSMQVEGSLGYAHWVCTLLQDKAKHSTEMYRYAIHQMSAIPAASDALARYLGKNCLQCPCTCSHSMIIVCYYATLSFTGN